VRVVGRILLSIAVGLAAGAAPPQEAPPSPSPSAPPRLPANAKVYVAPYDNGFETYLVAAFKKKQVPIVVLNQREGADFQIAGIADSKDPSVGRKLLYLWQTGPDEVATMSVWDLRTGTVVYAYATRKKNSAHGKQSSAESLAKHLKAHIEGRE
jgi:hypothetical protein